MEKTSKHRYCHEKFILTWQTHQRFTMNTPLSFRILIFILGFNLLNGCHSAKIPVAYNLPQAPNYADPELWFTPKTLGDTAQVDVFYISPTCVWDWKDKSGNTYHYMDVYNSSQRDAIDQANALAYQLFGKSCRFYAPYYRQISMNSWFEPEETINERYQKAHQDIIKAFRYYIAHFNHNRPFILAGHSQGAKAVVELLKHNLTKDEYQRMIAAYVIGFSIDEKEAKDYPYLKPSTGALDIGTTIAYNSISRSDAMAFKQNVVCINPLNWKTDKTYASAAENLGSVFFYPNGQSDTLFHQVGGYIDNSVHAIIIDGLNAMDYYIPEIGKLFPLGSFHVQELNLYFLNIQANLQDRIEAFLNRKD